MNSLLERYKKSDHPLLKVLGDLGLIAIPILEFLITDPAWNDVKKYAQLGLLIFKIVAGISIPKNTVIALASLFLSSILFSSCATQKRCNDKFPCVVKDSIRIEHDVRIEKHDSLIYLPPDSAKLKAKLNCDSLGNVYFTELEIMRGSKTNVTATIKDNQLFVDCKIDSAQVAIKWNSTHTTDKFYETKTVEITTNILTGFQWFQVWCGRILWILLGILLIVTVLKNYKKWLP